MNHDQIAESCSLAMAPQPSLTGGRYEATRLLIVLVAVQVSRITVLVAFGRCQPARPARPSCCGAWGEKGVQKATPIRARHTLAAGPSALGAASGGEG